MTDLHETSNQKPAAPIDTIGWLFAAFVVVVVVVGAIAAMVAYNASDTTASNAVSHLAGRAGWGLYCRNSSGSLVKFTAAMTGVRHSVSRKLDASRRLYLLNHR